MWQILIHDEIDFFLDYAGSDVLGVPKIASSSKIWRIVKFNEF